MMTKTPNEINEDLLRPLFRTSWRFFVAFIPLALLVLAAYGAFIYQMWSGIGVAGIRRPVFWGFYITNFVFWIGISHAGTLTSAIRRMCNAGCRRTGKESRRSASPHD